MVVKNINYKKMAKSKEKDFVKVVGVKAPEGKPQHLIVGKTYEVSKETAENIIKSKQGKKA